MIFFIFFTTIFAARYGVDIAESISTSSITCLRDLGYDDFFIFRAWRSIGQFDSNAATTNSRAIDAGFASGNIDAYFYPCYSCGDAAGQVSTFWSTVTDKGMKFNRLYFDIEGTWSSSTSTNRKFFETLTNKAESLGIKSGIYGSKYYWGEILGSSYKFEFASTWKLWYAHYDNVKSFSDFESFGGWSSPYTKQYAGDQTACSHDVDYNFRDN